jgi:phage terminase small subunit
MAKRKRLSIFDEKEPPSYLPPLTDKNKRRPKEVTLSNGEKVIEPYHNADIAYRKYADTREDPEKINKAPKDKASKHKYPPPKNNPLFRNKWMRFIDGLVARDNFKTGHLDALEILCDLYVEYDELQETIRCEGRTYECISRHGKSIKLRPEVSQLERCKANISSFTLRLGLFPKKDHSTQDAESEKDSWA